MNIRWEHIEQSEWDKTRWNRGHGGEVTEGRVELHFFLHFASHSVFCALLPLPLLFTLFTFFLRHPILNPAIHLSNPCLNFLHFPLFNHPLAHSPPHISLSLFTFFSLSILLFHLSNPSVQISQKTRLSTGPVNWSGSTPCGYTMR